MAWLSLQQNEVKLDAADEVTVQNLFPMLFLICPSKAVLFAWILTILSLHMM